MDGVRSNKYPRLSQEEHHPEEDNNPEIGNLQLSSTSFFNGIPGSVTMSIFTYLTLYDLTRVAEVTRRWKFEEISLEGIRKVELMSILPKFALCNPTPLVIKLLPRLHLDNIALSQSLYIHIIPGITKLKAFDKATALALCIPEKTMQYLALHDIKEEQLKALPDIKEEERKEEMMARAAHTINKMDERLQPLEFYQLALAHAENGNFPEAYRIARKISGKQLLEVTLQNIAYIKKKKDQ